MAYARVWLKLRRKLLSGGLRDLSGANRLPLARSFSDGCSSIDLPGKGGSLSWWYVATRQKQPVCRFPSDDSMQPSCQALERQATQSLSKPRIIVSMQSWRVLEGGRTALQADHAAADW